LNTEVGLLIESPALVAQFSRLTPLRAIGAYELQLDDSRDGVGWVEHDADGSHTMTRDEPGASWVGDFKNWLLLKLLPEDLL
jgi:putative cardiolipin synthase